jgi:hypothetical protein
MGRIFSLIKSTNLFIVRETSAQRPEREGRREERGLEGGGRRERGLEREGEI